MPAPRPAHVVQACVLGAVLAQRGLRKGSLSPSGAAAAFWVAVLAWGSGPRFGATLLVFYLSGSKLTRVGHATKCKQDEASTEGGERDAAQVLSCSLFGSAVAAAFRYRIGDDRRVHLGSYDEDAWLVAAFVGFFASCAGDTWASEIGCLAARRPRLITAPWRAVPPGTNGGVSPLGSAASVAGGAFIGAAHGAVGYLSADDGGGDLAAAECATLLLLGAAAGFLGSLLDSLLGATLQRSAYDDEFKRIARPGRVVGVRALCGADVLSNHGVNAVSCLATALLSPSLARACRSLF